MSDTYLHIAEMVYQWEYVLIFVVGIVISVLLWCIDPKALSKKTRKVLISIVLLTSTALSSYIAYVKKEYDYLPDVTYNAYSYASVEQMLLNKGFKIKELLFDEVAEEKLENGEEPASYYFKVTRMEPEPGTFVDNDIAVTLSVTWLNFYENISVKPDGNFTNSGLPSVTPGEGKADVFDAKTFYGNVDERYMRAHNANEISLHISEEAANIYTENTVSNAGFYPEAVRVEVQLVDYKTNETIGSRTAYMGDEVIFDDIPDGIYYYMILAEGYERYVPYSLFRLEYNEFEEKDILTWGGCLRKIGSNYSEAFKILICDKQGIPFDNTEAEIRVISEENLSPDHYSTHYVTSDENGYLTVWRAVDDVEYYELAEFSVKAGCRLEVCFEGSAEFVLVEIQDGIGICKLSN